MAGNYPDVPAPRMAYDRDGTVGLSLDTGSASSATLSAAQVQNLNDESSASALRIHSGSSGSQWLGLIFPQLRDVLGYQVTVGLFSGGTVMALQWSPNTTSGLDGTWNTISSPHAYTGYNKISMRNNITPLALTGVRGMRWQYGSGGNAASDDVDIYTLHVYGGPSAGENVDRLRLWHPTLDEPLDDMTAADGAYLDWGEATRGTSQDRTFRIKNNSATLTANSIDLTIHVPTDTSPTVASQHTLSDGGAFAGTINIGNLSPGQISGIITLRRNTLSTAVLSLWTGRILVNPGSWT